VSSTKAPKIQDAYDFAGKDLARLEFAHDILYPGYGLFGFSGVGAANEYHAVVLDIDRDAGRGDNFIDDLAAGTDHFADPVDRNIEGRDARRVWRQIRTRFIDRLIHYVQNLQSGFMAFS